MNDNLDILLGAAALLILWVGWLIIPAILFK